MARKVVDGDILGGNVSKRNSDRGAVGIAYRENDQNDILEKAILSARSVTHV
jgi:hypothetical protein